MARRKVEEEFYHKQLITFINEKLESKHFKESIKKAGLVKVKREFDEMKRRFFDSYYEAIKNMES